ncbi:uncharacterized protein LOC105842952 [Bombyx mori]
MNAITTFSILIGAFLHCDGATNQDQIDHIARRLQLGIDNGLIIGAPTDPEHLPAAEPILPGHTLLRPARGMLKSAVKFPHRDLNNGAGVYGNFDNIGIRFDGKSDKVLYSGFRRNSKSFPESQEKIFFNNLRQKSKSRMRDPEKERYSSVTFENPRITSHKRNRIIHNLYSPKRGGHAYIFLSRPRRDDSDELDQKKEPWFWKNKKTFEDILLYTDVTEFPGLKSKLVRRRPNPLYEQINYWPFTEY